MGFSDCDMMRERISLELDGELSPHESSLLERHVVACPACAAFAADAARYTELLRSAPAEQPPEFGFPRRRGALRLSVGLGAGVASTAAAAIVALSVMPFAKQSGDRSRAVALSLVPAPAVVERAQGGSLVGLRHPSAVRLAPRPALGLQDATRHGLFDS